METAYWAFDSEAVVVSLMDERLPEAV
jgi:hypothetical protein